MKTNDTTGRRIASVIGAYVVIKAVLNMILGGSIADIVIGVVYMLFLYSGLEFVNYIIAALLAITVIRHIGYNVTNLPSSLVYLIEGVIDAVCAVLLCINKNVKAHFSSKWSEIKALIGK